MMLELIVKLLTALGVLTGAAGVAGAPADAPGSDAAKAAIEAAAPDTHVSTNVPDVTGLDRALEVVTNDTARDAIAGAAAAKAAGQDHKPAIVPPAAHAAPPVTDPPVDVPGAATSHR